MYKWEKDESTRKKTKKKTKLVIGINGKNGER